MTTDRFSLPRRLVIALVFLAALVSLFAGKPVLAQEQTATPPAQVQTTAPAPTATLTPLPTAVPTRTPIPAAYLQTDFQTNGLIFGAIVLVIVIVGGTLFSIRRGQK